MTCHLASSVEIGPPGYFAIILGVVILSIGSKAIHSACKGHRHAHRWLLVHLIALMSTIAIAFVLHFLGMEAIDEIRNRQLPVPKQEASDFMVVATVDSWFFYLVVMGFILLLAASIAVKRK